jgi:hypothetical protein
MASGVLPYILLNHCTAEGISKFSVTRFARLIPEDEGFREAFLTWIHAYFYPDGSIIKEYLAQLGPALPEIAAWPAPFFAILFKCLFADRGIDQAVLTRFLVHAAKASTSADLTRTVTRFLIQASAYVDFAISQRLIFQYVSQIAPLQRFVAYQELFGHISLIMTLVPISPPPMGKFPHSEYRPVLSLWFRSIDTLFLSGEKAGLFEAMNGFGVLATVLEAYTDEPLGAHITRYIFPVLPLLFTYYNIFKVERGFVVLMTPLLLFLLRNCEWVQFSGYWSLLSTEGQARFLDFVKEITNANAIATLASVCINLEDNKRACSYEVTWRLIHFLSLFSEIPALGERALGTIFDLLTAMLRAPEQSGEILPTLFRTFCFFVRRFSSLVFISETPLIVKLVSATVPVTQSRLAVARENAVAFLRWIVRAEYGYRHSSPRSAIALQSAICDWYLRLTDWTPFLDRVGSLPEVADFQSRLKAALAPRLPANRITAILDLYARCPNFPAIRARLYECIVEINLAAGDDCGAFVTQWRLCALIAHVVRLRGLGEACTGLSLLENEPPIDPKRWGRNSFLVFESPHFTEDSIGPALDTALKLCLKAGMTWMLGEVTSPLFDFLERRREFEQLAELYGDVANSYNALAAEDEPDVEFARALIGDGLKGEAGWNEIVFMAHRGRRRTAHPLINLPHTVLEPPGEPLATLKGDAIQIVKLHYSKAEMLTLKASKFIKDVMFAADAGWKMAYVRRITYTTKTPLPSCISLATVKASRSDRIRKDVYFIEKYEEFIAEFEDRIQAIAGVLPGASLEDKWPQCVVKVNTLPVLKLIGSLIDDGRIARAPWWQFARDLNLQWPTPVDAPEKVAALARKVWVVMKDAIKLLKKTHKFVRPTAEVAELLNKYESEFLAVW